MRVKQRRKPIMIKLRGSEISTTEVNCLNLEIIHKALHKEVSHKRKTKLEKLY